MDKWATRLKILLKTAVRMVGESREKVLTEEQFAKKRPSLLTLLEG